MRPTDEEYRKSFAAWYFARWGLRGHLKRRLLSPAPKEFFPSDGTPPRWVAAAIDEGVAYYEFIPEDQCAGS